MKSGGILVPGLATFLLLAIAGTSQKVMAADLLNWMAPLDGKKRLSEFSIPGTHDSGALHETFAGTAQCQRLPIASQLSIGVRFLDIRCVIDNGGFKIYHGTVDQQLTFDSVLNDCVSFLKAHPSETILMSIKKEHQEDDRTKFENVFDSYHSKNPDIWLLKDAIPTLDEARGKIVLLRRFYASKLPKGIAAAPAEWKDSQTFSINGATEIRVQDKYALDKKEQKWPEIRALLQEASKGRQDVLYLNFTSAYVKKTVLNIPDIHEALNAVTPAMLSYFDNSPSGRYGVIIMDFADEPKCAKVIATNN
jgi:1-phosphatidylinositol phosphodiesterase